VSLTCDDFLDGQLSLWQPAKGYRAGIDPVLLAACVPAKPGQSVLELGSGVGTAILCLGHRVNDLVLSAVELQLDYADLAKRNAEKNNQSLAVHIADIANLPGDLRQQQFDHVLMNPPYYDRTKSTRSSDDGRDTALGGETPLETWIDVAAKRLVPKGYLSLIQRMDRLPDVLAAIQDRLGSVEVLPLAPRTGRRADLFLLRARKGGRAAFVLHAPLILHEGAVHQQDGESYREDIRKILRNGAALRWPD
jgi:tRNA1(Val) A37 N6-methylase TrmN6